jgi:fatty acid-binding protein DegV
MKAIATILEGVKSRFPHTDLSAVLLMATGASSTNDEAKIWPIDSGTLAAGWGCTAEEVKLLSKWGCDLDQEDYDDIWAEVGH